MSRFRNTNPFTPWNDPMSAHDPFKPFNDPFFKGDPFAPWNTPFGDEEDYRRYCEENHLDE